jgi:Zn-dependent M28 family amino/carboxypeptidase
MYTIEIALVVVLASAVGYFAYLGYGLLSPSLVAEPFSGEQAMSYVTKQIEFGERSTGSASNVRMGDWLVDELRTQGWDVLIQPFTVGNSVAARNIIAIRSTGEAGRPVAILGTHYDTRLYADLDPNPADRIQPAIGANVGASGVAVLLELARTLDVPATGHTVCLLFLDAEDNVDLPGWQDALGSAYFLQRVNNDVVRCRNARFAVMMDMVGASEQRIFADADSTGTVVAALWQVAEELGYNAWFSGEEANAPSRGHLLFQETGTPAIAIGGYDYPHRYTLADTPNKLSVAALERVGRTLKSWLERRAPF